MLIKNLQLGQMEANCYIVTDDKSMQCAVIDPGDESNTVLDYVEDNKLAVKYILLTHGHFDHTGGNSCWPEAWMTKEAAVYAKVPFSPMHKEWFDSKEYPDY